LFGIILGISCHYCSIREWDQRRAAPSLFMFYFEHVIFFISVPLTVYIL
jgi:hypothetical protein